LPRVVKLSFSEAAAKTVTVPVSFLAESADAEEEESFWEEDASEPEEQALSASSAATPAPVTCTVRRVRRA
jgi:hypothetical protein